ncbi:MAG: hypothetical protein QOK36_990 [Gaiellales bacterium]|jgi:hypothetical protein|nr:hypothetical protein [Gaiellales bacterium]
MFGRSATLDVAGRRGCSLAIRVDARVGNPWDLSEEQFEAIRALQRGAPASPVDDEVWSSLLAMGMVWIDESGEPALVRLTPIGRNYDAR